MSFINERGSAFVVFFHVSLALGWCLWQAKQAGRHPHSSQCCLSFIFPCFFVASAFPFEAFLPFDSALIWTPPSSQFHKRCLSECHHSDCGNGSSPLHHWCMIFLTRLIRLSKPSQARRNSSCASIKHHHHLTSHQCSSWPYEKASFSVHFEIGHRSLLASDRRDPDWCGYHHRVSFEYQRESRYLPGASQYALLS